MPNFASIIKDEITRIARKQVRMETAALKKAAASHRSDIAALKQRVHALELALRRASKAGARAPAADGASGTAAVEGLRFSAKGLASNRARLGLSAADCGLLIGASGQSVYLWESGRARRSARLLPAVAALRKMGKREANARLAVLKEAAGA